MRIPILISIFLFLAGCRGELIGEVPSKSEVEAPPPKAVVVVEKPKPEPVMKPKPKPREIDVAKFEESLTEDDAEAIDLYALEDEQNLKEGIAATERELATAGFKFVGINLEDGCRKKIFRREYEVSWLYKILDCEGGLDKQFVRKE
ncbi:MAG: hypothetical protein GY866_12460 [Proteobacteria bacterium]|nr:hypothetical protein [Pseudomonadota bacterium]